MRNFKPNNNKENENNSASKIMAAIIIIIILLLGGALGTIIGNRTTLINNTTEEYHQEKNYGITIGEILMMPLYYVVCYPKVLLNLAAGEYTEGCGSPGTQRQKAKKQYLPR